MDSIDLKNRTKKFALQIIGFAQLLPHERITDIITKQLVRAATSVGANYRAACRTRSKADFISKTTIVEEEADECAYWLELLSEANYVNHADMTGLSKEANELTAIFTASGKTAKRNR